METSRAVDLTDLEEGTVLIIDTDKESYKIIVGGGIFDVETLDFRTHLLSKSSDDFNNESEPISVIINHAKVGKPMLIVEAPTRNKDGLVELGCSRHTGKVRKIEIYE